VLPKYQVLKSVCAKGNIGLLRPSQQLASGFSLTYYQCSIVKSRYSQQNYKHAFSALTLLVGWQERHLSHKKIEWWDAGVVICLGRGADLNMAQLMPLPLTISRSSKFRLVLPSWFYLSGTGSPR